MIIRPATFFDALEFAGSKAFLRKVLVYQVRNSEAFVVEHGGELLALGMFHRVRGRRVEFALSVRPSAQKHMVGLVRLAHLTIGRVLHSGSMVFARVRTGDPRAQRMARLTGFVPGRMADPAIWIFRRCHERDDWITDGRNPKETGTDGSPAAPTG